MIRIGKSEKTFQNAYRDFSGNIRRTLRGMVGSEAIAEELTQEAFIKAWKGLPQFGYRSSLKTWLYQVAINVGRDWLRSHRSTFFSDDYERTFTDVPTPEQRAVQESLMEIDEDTRSLLILHYYEGLKLEEIGDVLKVPVGTVKSRLHGAKSKLKEKLLLKGFDV